jgi:hypothetical protein
MHAHRSSNLRGGVTTRPQHDCKSWWGHSLRWACHTVVHPLYSHHEQDAVAAAAHVRPLVRHVGRSLPLLRLRAIRKLPLGNLPGKALTSVEVHALVTRAQGQLKGWLALTYLVGLRLVETVRLVGGRGHWSEHGIFILSESKTAK